MVILFRLCLSFFSWCAFPEWSSIYVADGINNKCLGCRGSQGIPVTCLKFHFNSILFFSHYITVDCGDKVSGENLRIKKLALRCPKTKMKLED